MRALRALRAFDAAVQGRTSPRLGAVLARLPDAPAAAPGVSASADDIAELRGALAELTLALRLKPLSSPTTPAQLALVTLATLRQVSGGIADSEQRRRRLAGRFDG